MRQLVPVDGVLDLIQKAAAVDLGAANILWQISLYEAMCDLTDDYGPMLERDFEKMADRRTADTRRAIIRTAVSKRLAGGSIDDLVTAAAHLTVLEEIAKDESADTRRAASSHQPRDHGRFATVNRALDRIRAFTQGGDQSDLAQFTRPTSGTDRRAYRQLKMTGDALRASAAIPSAVQPHAALLGNAASLVGELGKEAERVLGPGIKRTAYRYRGTEKRPNRQLQIASQRLNTEIDALAALERTDPQAGYRERQRLAGRSGGADTDVALARALNSPGGMNLSADQLRLRAQSDVATVALLSRVPDLEHAKLSLAAGKLPPSTGMIIDADGDIVAEASGYNGDHYLPFDLRNLGRMHGGAYVRTRTSGGPTDEDVYTALLTGARQLQVVSNSGVFTMELDPDLRGGRRYSDRARQMVDRYARLLAAVGSEQLYSDDLSPAEQQKIRQAYARSHPHLSAEQVKDGADADIDRERQSRRFQTLTDDELLDEAGRQAKDELAGQPGGGEQLGRRRRQIYDKLRDKQRQTQVKTYRLDGTGYHAAMKALAQEFPYYIRDIDAQPLSDWLPERGVRRGPRDYRGVDIGRTEHRGLTPRGARSVGWKQPDGPTTAPAAAATDAAAPAAAAAATPAGGAEGKPWIAAGTRPLSARLGDEKTRFSRDLSHNVAQVLDLTDDMPAYKDLSFDAGDLNDESIASDPDMFVYWARAHHNDVGPWLLADPKRVDVVDRVLKSIRNRNFTPEVLQDAEVAELTDKLGAVRTVTQPYTKPGDSPALTVPENDRPVAIPEIVELGDMMGNYSAYLDAHPDVATATRQMTAMTNPDIALEITEQVERYHAMQAWAKAGFSDEERGRLTTADQPEAEDVHRLGEDSQTYRDLDAAQKAWTLLEQRKALAVLTGKEIPTDTGQGAAPDPKAAAAEPPNTVRKQQRPRVVVHPPGSPLSVALAKRQASRSPRPPRRRGTW